MSKAFVRGLSRDSMPKYDTPAGYVKLKCHGRKKFYQRPIPFRSGKPDLANGVTVDEDGVGLFTMQEASYLLEMCAGAFTRIEPVEVGREPEPTLTDKAMKMAPTVVPEEVASVDIPEDPDLSAVLEDLDDDNPSTPPVEAVKDKTSGTKKRRR